MSIFSSIQMAGNTLQAMQIGLHVVGNNIANANTPGYIRETTLYSPAPVQRYGSLTLGLGVEIAGIVQNVDTFAQVRLLDTGSERASAEVQEDIYRDLELAIGELSDADISTALSNFFTSISKVHDQPEDIAIRNLAIADGLTLTQSINTLDRRVRDIQADYSERVIDIATQINTLTEEIRQLNLQISAAENGGSGSSDAGGLRSQRNLALTNLAELTNINVSEQASGAVNVSVNGDLLIYEGNRREVKSETVNENDTVRTVIQFSDNGGELQVTSGELHGIYGARDEVVAGFLDNLDDFASTLAFEFNKIYSKGEGTVGFSSLTSVDSVEDPSLSLSDAGLSFTPQSGVFQLNVTNTETEPVLTETNDIIVDLNGLDGDTTLNTLAAAINAVEGISATVNIKNQLEITADSDAVEFSFSGDTSGVLAALGINTFFTGSAANEISVNEVLREDSTSGALFAADGRGLGPGTGNQIALELMSLNQTGLGSLDGGTITGVYDQMINDVTQGATVTASVADGLRVFEGTLQAEVASVSGVNLDEEAIDMITLQSTYTASARYITTLTEMLDILLAL